MIRFSALTALVCSLALPALANEQAVKARQGQFQMYAINLGVLANMAQGRIPYDAALAQEVADNLFHLTRNSQYGLWPEGTDNASMSGTRALPVIWSDNAGFLERYAALQAAAEAMKAAAGQGLEAVQANLAALGGACQACHQQYRAP